MSCIPSTETFIILNTRDLYSETIYAEVKNNIRSKRSLYG